MLNRQFAINAREIHIANSEGTSHDDIVLKSTGHKGEHDILVQETNFKFSNGDIKLETGSLQTNTLQDVDGNDGITFGSNTIDFHNRTAQNLALGVGSINASTVASANGFASVDAELDHIETNKLEKGGHTASRLLATSAGGFVVASGINSTLPTTNQTNISTNSGNISVNATNITALDNSAVKKSATQTLTGTHFYDVTGQLTVNSGRFHIYSNANTTLATFSHANSSNVVLTLPSSTGTLALTSDIQSIPTALSSFTNDTNFITTSQVITGGNGTAGEMIQTNGDGTIGRTALIKATNSAINLNTNSLIIDNTTGNVGIQGFSATNVALAVLGNIRCKLPNETTENPTAWNSNFCVFGENTGQGGIGFSYNQTQNRGVIYCLEPNVAWRELRYKANSHKFLYENSTDLLELTNSGATFDTQVAIQGATHRDFSTTDTDITGQLPSGSSAFGHIIEGRASGHLVLGIRGNDSKDSVTIASRTSGSSYDTPVAVFQADGKVGIGTSSPNSKLHILSTQPSNGDPGFISKIQETNNTYFSQFTQRAMFGSGALFHFKLNEYNENQTTTNPGFLVEGRGGSDFFCIKQNGRVGIGTDNPSFPLEVQGGTNPSGSYTRISPEHKASVSGSPNFYVVADRTTTNPLSTSGADTDGKIGIECDDCSVKAHYYFFNSDRRIKKCITDLSDNESLSIIRDISCVKYKYIDTIGRGSNWTYGFIANQVAEVFPNAVKMIKNTIPDEMRDISNCDWSGNKILVPDLSDNKYKLIFGNGDREQQKIVDYVDGGFLLDNSYNQVFLYGKEVDDFHILDKSKIYAVLTSAVQELDKQVSSLKNKLADEEVKTAYFEMQINQIKSHLNI